MIRSHPLAALAATLALAATAPGPAQGIRPSERPPATQPTSRPASRPAPLPATGLARRLEKAHGLTEWPGDRALRCDVVVEFGGETILKGVMTFEHPSGRCRIETADAVAVFDGETAWVKPGAGVPRARFHLLTWPYFLVAPFKLRDPGANLESTGLKPMAGGLCETARLTFDGGVGDTPEDWYVVYVDPRTGRLMALAYIVTYGTPTAEAEKAPHAAVYRDYADVGGVILPTLLTFHDWDGTRRAHEARIGEARFTGHRFVTPAGDAFAKPEGAAEDPLP